MKKYLCIFLPLLLIAASISACNNKEPSSTTGSVDLISKTMESPHEQPQLSKDEFKEPSSTTGSVDLISKTMESPHEQPQLSKDEFVEITNNYLSTKEWELPYEKACLYTSGLNWVYYIIEDEYLFSLNFNINTDGSIEYDFYLSHYIDGVVTELETDPLLFEKFIK